MKPCIIFAFCMLSLMACKQKPTESNLAENNSVEVINKNDNAILPLKNAKNFILSKHEHIQGAHWLQIPQPWAGAKDTLKYLICPKDILATIRLAPQEASIIATPIERIVCTSTIQAAMCHQLGMSDKIVGITESENLYNEELYKKVQENTIIDLGSNQQINYEKLMLLQPELILIFGMNAPSKMISKLEELQMPTLYMAEYLESSALGRAEWIKLMALLFNDFEKGTMVFDKDIYEPYVQVMQKAKEIAAVKTKPLVFTGIALEGQWYVSGGESFIAKLISDAQGEYIFANEKTTGTVPYAFEKVYVAAQNANIWIDVWQAKSKKDLAQMNEHYTQFAAYKNNKVFNYLKRISANGGYDIFESAVIQPHLLLHDLVQIFYGDQSAHNSLKYYTPLH